MIDDLKYIHKVDKSDALGLIAKQWQQLTYKFDVILDERKISNIVLAGMGGSGWPIRYIASWPGLNVPMEVCSNYDLPTYVNATTLVIVSSYSGNTEETLSALKQAQQKGCVIVVVSSGGELTKIATQEQLSLYAIPGGIQPRMSSFYFIAAFLSMLSQYGLLCDIPSDDLMVELSQWLSQQTADLLPEVPASRNPAKKLAQEIMGKTPIIYSGPSLAPVAQKMKICVNENAKSTAWWGQYPEFSHNEFIGWSSHPINKPFTIIEFRSNLDHPRIQKRFEVTEKLLSGKRPHPHIIRPHGDSITKQLFWSSMFADFVCTYLAILNGVDPTPVDLVEKFKHELD
ncbi:bifunctional phosphoglucose/phosphomannose isomerase [Candidatus Saccharibacteria bacterium]|nr:bifunctional phosphoglucose/phosphomannose isomerase [Candidatus Saccharibacteria bacterium]